jgi:hypothetical protein
MWVSAGEVTGERLGTIDKSVRLVVPLPPLAEAGTGGAAGKTWQQAGTIEGSLETVRGDFECSLRGAGWRRDKVIGLGRSELTTWERGRRRMLMMVWEKEAGRCGFTWGEEK